MSLSAEVTALRQRQGAGARYDAPNAPHDDLLLARRGAAYFARQLNRLDDAALNAPSLVQGYSRRSLISRISYQARDLANRIGARRTGIPPAHITAAEITLGATLPARALRSLFYHADVHLNVEWRDLDAAGWDEELTDAAGQHICLRDTPLHRATDVWQAAIDLGSGGRLRDVPPPLRTKLCAR